ncbi:hypothetical protein RFM98_30340 [Mesorhizobium sp. VK9D]|uniref:hypothetical protein n=1 Tax=Mesorhizobium australafricanum TaxID=3072311 RepID=UPI002A24A829|nr:hypothetical protein [Mesorhizobium sp. VK9D]MDX8457040.1 hypothetical protein [Mesorhizobium sp. VK9D]
MSFAASDHEAAYVIKAGTCRSARTKVGESDVDKFREQCPPEASCLTSKHNLERDAAVGLLGDRTARRRPFHNGSEILFGTFLAFNHPLIPGRPSAVKALRSVTQTCSFWIDEVREHDPQAFAFVAGPKLCALLVRIVDGFDLANDVFPFIASAELTVSGGLRAQLFRISVSGELAYEIAVPARYGHARWSG